jgi:TPR repeat protein
MSVSIKCPQCASILRLPPEAFGKRVRCKQCAARFLAPKEKNADIPDELALEFLLLHGDAEPSPGQAAHLFYRGAIGGNTDAMYNLASCYEQGDGVEKDFTKAAMWYRRAAENGDLSSAFHLGGMYEDGRGVKRDCCEAARWFGRAARASDTFGHLAKAQLSLYYLNGEGLEQNDSLAFQFARSSAQSGCPAGMALLSFLYGEGRGVVRNQQKAAYWKKQEKKQARKMGYEYGH